VVLVSVVAVGTLTACKNGSGPSDMGAASDLALEPGTLGGPCTLFADGGCNDTLHCAVAAVGDMGRDTCVPADKATLPQGQSCTSTVTLGTTSTQQAIVGDQCQDSLACVELRGTSECRKLCRHREDCASNEVCGLATASSSHTSTCLVPDECDPIGQTGCPTGSACYVANDNDGRFTSCQITVGMGKQVAQECKAQRECAPGLTCVGLGFCRHLCWVLPPPGASSGICGADEPACMVLPGTDNLGVCDEL
jgi:hypothetical protein